MIWEAIQTVAVVYCVVQVTRHFRWHHVMDDEWLVRHSDGSQEAT